MELGGEVISFDNTELSFTHETVRLDVLIRGFGVAGFLFGGFLVLSVIT